MQEAKYKTGFLQMTVCTKGKKQNIIYEDVVAVQSVSG